MNNYMVGQKFTKRYEIDSWNNYNFISGKLDIEQEDVESFSVLPMGDYNLPNYNKSIKSIEIKNTKNCMLIYRS